MKNFIFTIRNNSSFSVTQDIPRGGELKLCLIAESGIRTHEAIARDLKSRPFDRSGIPA